MATIVFVAAHQDDESLSMGPAIRAHLEARDAAGGPAHEVHVLLLTTGENSGVRAQMGMDAPTFTAARDDELRRATRQLGVPFERIHLNEAGRVPDGELTEAAATAGISWFLAQHPDAWVKTHSHLAAPGRHADHRNAGLAAVALLQAGLIVPNGLRLYAEPYQLQAIRDANLGVAISAEHAANGAIVTKALGEYKAQDGVGFKYGIGYRSVPSAFDTVMANQASYYHLP